MTAHALVSKPPHPPTKEPIANGTIRNVEGEERIFYEGYWVRHYKVVESLSLKRSLIDSLARRVFHHAESGINTPGNRLEEVQLAYEQEQNPGRKRVLAAMLAGALLNRGTDILTRIVQLEQIGVKLKPDNELIKECGRCFMGALEHGKFIRPVTGKEGLNELWGEPFKAFTMSVSSFLETRYLKIAMTMRAVDSIRDKLLELFEDDPLFAPMIPLITELADSARHAAETMRIDPHNIEVWPRFVSAADRLSNTEPVISEDTGRFKLTLAHRGTELIHRGGELMVHLATLRVPMPKTTQRFLRHCDRFTGRFRVRSPRRH